MSGAGGVFQRAEYELRAIIDTIPALVARYLPDGTPDFVNQTWRDYTGLSLEDLKGSRWGIGIHPDDVAAVTEQWLSHLATGAAFVMEQRLRRADGEYRWLLVHRKPLRDEAGKIVNWYGIAHDIEDRKRAEAKIQTAERELRATIDTMPALVARCLPDGTPDFVNQTWKDYTGLSLEDLRADRGIAIHPDDLSRVTAQWLSHFASGNAFVVEERLRCANGEYRWLLVHCKPLRDEAGKIINWFMVGHDFEDRKRIEDALRDSEQRFRDFGEAASDWYWETGPDHRFAFTQNDRPLFASLAIPNRLGLLRWEAGAADVDAEPAKWRAHVATLDAHEPFRNFTYQIKLRDGSTKYVSVSGIPRFDGEGRFLGYRGGGSDVTALVRADQAQKALRQARAELSHVTRVTTLGELTASIAHEVNQPFAGIVGNGTACLNWLEKDPPRLDEVRASVEAMIDDCNRAAAIVARIRAMAKKGEPQKEVFDINDLVRESVFLVQRELRNHDIELYQEFGPDLPSVFGDRVQLQQVVVNLVMNAIESMEAVDSRRRKMLIRSSSIEGEQIAVEVQDTGTGIDPANAETLFDAFFTTKHKGLGMGLSISRSIIEAHDGRLTARNASPGATFRFTLPSYKAA